VITNAGRRARTRRAALNSGLAFALVVLTASFLTSAVSCESISPGRPQPTTGPDAGAPVMRVRLGETRVEAEFGSDGSIELAAAGATGGAMRTSPGDSVKVTFDGEGWLASQSAGGDRRLGGGSLQIRQLSPEPIKFMNGLHEGQFTLIPRGEVSAGGFDVIERVGIDIYIAGVISKELYATWTPAAFESQAIAARSYAMHERQRQLIANREWDIESTDSDQVYAGAAANPTALRAAQATRGKVLEYNGHLLRAYYSSTCGGRAASARDIWPTGPGFEFNLAWPIQAHDRPCACEASPLYRWEVRRTNDDVLLRIVGFGKANGYAVRSMTSLKDIKVDRTNSIGRPTRYKLFDDTGKSWTLTAEDLRRAMNFTGGGGGLAPITRDIRVHSSDFEVKPSGDSFVFNGQGFGHGVGLCQFGAEGFGKKSKTADQILGIMYPGAVITSAY
jgi:stage II sporulation protein D